MNRVDNPRSIIYAVLAIILAILIVSFARHYLQFQELTNLNLHTEGISDLYIQMSPDLPGKCHVTNRRGSTFRRSDDPSARRLWNYRRSAGDNDTGNLNHWMLQSTAKKIFLLVPVNDVKDWTYPYIYQFVKGSENEVELPSVQWVQLYVNRIYHGLYLQVYLPHDPRRRDGGSGHLRELLVLRDSTIACLNTRFSNPCTAYQTMVSTSKFPTLITPSKLVMWLITHSPIEETLFIMRPYAPYQITYLPLSISLSEEYSKIDGKSLPEWVDNRFATFHPTYSPESLQLTNILSAKKTQKLLEEWKTYKSNFTHALKIHCEYHQCKNEIILDLPKRLESSWEKTQKELSGASA